MTQLQLSKMLTEGKWILNEVQKGNDTAAYDKQINQLNSDIHAWIRSKKQKGISQEEQQQMQQLSKYYSQILDSLNCQRHELYRELYQLNNAKKLDNTYSL